ncbi:hypothetical protein QR66_00040 [Chromobacterium piscinae]|nr:hypothetical protein QR66_00040 [Chromobacterium piscinae]
MFEHDLGLDILPPRPAYATLELIEWLQGAQTPNDLEHWFGALRETLPWLPPATLVVTSLRRHHDPLRFVAQSFAEDGWYLLCEKAGVIDTLPALADTFLSDEPVFWSPILAHDMLDEPEYADIQHLAEKRHLTHGQAWMQRSLVSRIVFTLDGRVAESDLMVITLARLLWPALRQTCRRLLLQHDPLGALPAEQAQAILLLAQGKTLHQISVALSLPDAGVAKLLQTACERFDVADTASLLALTAGPARLYC